MSFMHNTQFLPDTTTVPESLRKTVNPLRVLTGDHFIIFCFRVLANYDADAILPNPRLGRVIRESG